VGSTGFVGGHLRKHHSFDQFVHRSNIESIQGLETDLLICAGLPAEKWRANREPEADWLNVKKLADTLSRVRAHKAILISTIDVYQPAIDVTEDMPANFDGAGAYGTHRAWFEAFFQTQFKQSSVIRLPGLFANNLKKNLIFDLLNHKSDQWEKVNTKSTFQFFNLERIWDVISFVEQTEIKIMNVSSQPTSAGEIAKLFDIVLGENSEKVSYNMKTIHDLEFGGFDGYLFSKESILSDINSLRLNWDKK